MTDTENNDVLPQGLSNITADNEAAVSKAIGLNALQKQFMQMFQGLDDNVFKQQVLEQGTVDVTQRVDIYRHAYLARLRECIETDHELLAVYLGDELFEQMVQGYVAEHPSQLTSLRYFCDALPDFLTTHHPFKSHPVLSEIARFERNLLNAFDAGDDTIATLDDLRCINADHWPAMQFSLHPSVRLFETDWNCVLIWQALKQQQTPPPAQKQMQSWIIWRNQHRLTEFKSLDVTAYVLLEGILQGLEFSVLCENLSEFIPYDTVSEKALSCILGWIEDGVISSCYLD